MQGCRSMTGGFLQDMEEVKQLGTELLGGVSDAAEAAEAALLDFKETMHKLQMIVEGCTAFIPAKECKASTSLSNLNACVQQLDGSVTHELGQGIITSQSGATTPTCNATRVCPCCADCSKGAAGVDSIMRMLPTKKSLEVFKYPTIQPTTFSESMISLIRICMLRICLYLHIEKIHNMHSFMRSYANMYTHVHVCIYTYSCLYMCMCVCVCVYIHIHTHIHMYTYIKNLVLENIQLAVLYMYLYTLGTCPGLCARFCSRAFCKTLKVRWKFTEKRLAVFQNKHIQTYFEKCLRALAIWSTCLKIESIPVRAHSFKRTILSNQGHFQQLDA
jgi:hypothetical protein